MAEQKIKIACASSDGMVVNRHFGRAERFSIYEAAPDGESTFLENRAVTPVCQGGEHSNADLEANLDALSDCQVIVASRIGPGALAAAARRGIACFESSGMIEDCIEEYFEEQNMQRLIYGR